MDFGIKPEMPAFDSSSSSEMRTQTMPASGREHCSSRARPSPSFAPLGPGSAAAFHSPPMLDRSAAFSRSSAVSLGSFASNISPPAAATSLARAMSSALMASGATAAVCLLPSQVATIVSVIT